MKKINLQTDIKKGMKITNLTILLAKQETAPEILFFIDTNQQIQSCTKPHQSTFSPLSIISIASIMAIYATMTAIPYHQISQQSDMPKLQEGMM